MKLQRSELKAIVKECLKELINEGAMNTIIAEMVRTQGLPMPAYPQGYPQPMMGYPPQQRNTSPKVKMAAAAAAKTPQEAKLYETIFAGAEETMAEQTAVDPDPDSIRQYNEQHQDYYFNNQQPHYPQQQYNQYPSQYYQPQYPPQQPQYMHNQMPIPHPQQPPQTHGGASKWAQLAFNSPIKNRPDASSGGGMGGMGGMPGTNMGKFD